VRTYVCDMRVREAKKTREKRERERREREKGERREREGREKVRCAYIDALLVNKLLTFCECTHECSGY